MMSITRIRLVGLVASIAAVAAFGAPSAALAGKSHHTSVYKVEDHVELEGEDGTYSLSCKSTDIAIDGMWRVDNVDQDNDWVDPDPALEAFWAPVADGGIGTSPDLTIRKAIRPMASYADAANPSKYWFKFTPLAGADVQIKLFITCLPNPLTGFGHTHQWRFTVDPTQSASAADPAEPQATDMNAAPPSFTASCPAKTVLVQPGFETPDTNVHIVTSMPFNSGPNWMHREWAWKAYRDSAAAGTVVYTWRCLDVKSSPHPGPVNGHTHKLVYNKKQTTWDDTGVPVKPKVGPQQVSERQEHCGEHYKGMIGGWDVSPSWRAFFAGPPPPNGYPHHMAVYYLGMDPRIKSRAFRFLNLDELSQTVRTALVCWKDRTT